MSCGHVYVSIQFSYASWLECRHCGHRPTEAEWNEYQPVEEVS